MEKIEIAKIMHKEKKIIEEKTGYKVVYIAVYGSQNYGLDIYTDSYRSDLDMKAIVMPTLDDIIRDSKPISATISYEYGDCDVKDIRRYIEVLAKVNPAYIETLYTNMSITDSDYHESFSDILGLRSLLVESLPVSFCKAIYGMMKEKEKALCHPYPSIADKIDRLGYDGKQAHHILRLWLMMHDYFERGESLSHCFYPNNAYKKILMGLKLNSYSLDEVVGYVDGIMNNAYKLRCKILTEMEDIYHIKKEIVNMSHKLIKEKICNDITFGGNYA